MTLNLKTTILLSTLLAVVLNVGQFLASTISRRDAFSPAWAYADKASAPSGPAKLSLIPVAAPAGSSGGGSSVAPAADAAGIAIALERNGMRSDFAPLYLSVQRQTGTPWQLLAAVHKVETGQSGNTARTSYAGATGPMQFMPATFNSYAADGDANGTRDITDIDDAMLAAGRYLGANGASKGQYSTALYHYNHSWSYVSQVTGIAKSLGL
jgi:soluble lytic murein transglycosylase-like protein